VIDFFWTNDAKNRDEHASPARKEVIPIVIAQFVSEKKKKRILVL
jgi:hypothetical protein